MMDNKYLTQPENVRKFLIEFSSVKAKAVYQNDTESLALIYSFEYALEKAIPTFSAKQRESFVLVYLEGKSQRQAADILGITQQAVQASNKIASRKIANAIRDEFGLPQLG